MSPKPSASKERIPQILGAAVKVFSRRGLSKARMEDIAGEAGLSKGTLYLYFKSKDSIIQGLMRSMLARELSHAKELAAGEGTAAQKLDHFIEFMVNDIDKMGPFVPLYFELISLASRRTGVQKLFRLYFEEFQTILETLIQSGIDSGEFRPVNAYEAALAVGAIFEGTILLWVYAPDLADLKTHVNSSIHLLLAGLCSSPPGFASPGERLTQGGT